MIRSALLAAALLAAFAGFEPAASQSVADAQALAVMSDKALMKLPAKKVFGGQKEPTTNLKARAIGSYARGCMAGGQALPPGCGVPRGLAQAMVLALRRAWLDVSLAALCVPIVQATRIPPSTPCAFRGGVQIAGRGCASPARAAPPAPRRVGTRAFRTPP